MTTNQPDHDLISAIEIAKSIRKYAKAAFNSKREDIRAVIYAAILESKQLLDPSETVEIKEKIKQGLIAGIKNGQ